VGAAVNRSYHRSRFHTLPKGACIMIASTTTAATTTTTGPILALDLGKFKSVGCSSRRTRIAAVEATAINI
jgi:hypothetical protein